MSSETLNSRVERLIRQVEILLEETRKITARASQFTESLEALNRIVIQLDQKQMEDSEMYFQQMLDERYKANPAWIPRTEKGTVRVTPEACFRNEGKNNQIECCTGHDDFPHSQHGFNPQLNTMTDLIVKTYDQTKNCCEEIKRKIDGIKFTTPGRRKIHLEPPPPPAGSGDTGASKGMDFSLLEWKR